MIEREQDAVITGAQVIIPRSCALPKHTYLRCSYGCGGGSWISIPGVHDRSSTARISTAGAPASRRILTNMAGIAWGKELPGVGCHYAATPEWRGGDCSQCTNNTGSATNAAAPEWCSDDCS